MEAAETAGTDDYERGVVLLGRAGERGHGMTAEHRQANVDACRLMLGDLFADLGFARVLPVGSGVGEIVRAGIVRVQGMHASAKG
jgi:hypothetical protein